MKIFENFIYIIVAIRTIVEMASAARMHTFLQRMLRKNDDETKECKESDKSVCSDDTSKSGIVKGGWMKKLGNYSPSKYKIPASTLKTETLNSFDGSSRRRSCPATTTPRKVAVLPNPPLEMPDLESIIRDFEMGFMSPNKEDLPADTNRGSFVKKIVAAFEVKYKAYNELKAEEEVKEVGEVNGDGNGERSSQRRAIKKNEEKSGMFTCPAKTVQDDAGIGKKKSSSGVSTTRTDREASRSKDKISRIFASPRRTRETALEGSKKSAGKTVTPSSTSRRRFFDQQPEERQVEGEEKKSPSKERRKPLSAKLNVPHTTHSKTSSMAFSTPIKNVAKNCQYAGRRKPVPHSTPLSLHFQEGMTARSPTYVDLSISLPYESDETTLTAEDSAIIYHEEQNDTDDFTVTSIIGKNCRETEVQKLRGDESKRVEGRKDDTPRIIGAFLKKPIEVDDTAIDWIPITGKRLPRKRSLKKLLSVLRSRKASSKRSALLFSPQRNTSEETREHQDSGYDEKSSSSSSMTSLLSISDVLLHHEGNQLNQSGSATLGTFRSKNASIRSNKELNDEISNGRRRKEKLVLSEVPREKVSIDLGPCFPSGESLTSFGDAQRYRSASSMVTMSLDRRSRSKLTNPVVPLPKHPAICPVAKIPKHPFVSSSFPKDDFNSNPVSSTTGQSFEGVQLRRKTPSSTEAPTIRISNSLYEVEFRRSFDGFPSPKYYRDSCFSVESTYDIPRRFLSKSESGLPEIIGQDIRHNTLENGAVYDVPKTQALNLNSQRPRSSVYEDAISLKRRTAQLTSNTLIPGLYGFADEEETPHYATVKPRNRRIYLSAEMIKQDERSQPHKN